MTYCVFQQIDFGDAKCIDEVEEKRDESEGLQRELDPSNMEADFERRGTFVGTLNYVAPEMIQSNDATLSTDIWSMGCIIYKILTG